MEGLAVVHHFKALATLGEEVVEDCKYYFCQHFTVHHDLSIIYC